MGAFPGARFLGALLFLLLRGGLGLGLLPLLGLGGLGVAFLVWWFGFARFVREGMRLRVRIGGCLLVLEVVKRSVV